MAKVIWNVSKYALPPSFGIQYRLFFLSKAFNRKGHESYVFTSATNHLAHLPEQTANFRSEEIEGSKTIFIKGMKFKTSQSNSRVLSWFIFEYYFFLFILKDYKKFVKKPDVVIISSLSLITILNGYFAKRKFKCKLIFEIRDIWPLSAILVTGHSKWHPFIIFLRWVEKFGYRHADIVTSTLPNASAHIERSIGRKVNFKCIPQGFDVEHMASGKELSEEFFCTYFPPNKFYIAYIGNIVAAYDLETLISCARQLDKENTNIHFLVLGDGNYKETLINQADGLSNITFIPRVTKAEVQSFLKRCDVMTNFLRPEPLFEFGVSPQKLVDYMYAGKPVIMSYTGYKTVIEEVGCGTEVTAGDVPNLCKAFVEYSHKSKEELAAMGQKGRDYLINNLSWDKISDDYIALF